MTEETDREAAQFLQRGFENVAIPGPTLVTLTAGRELAVAKSTRNSNLRPASSGLDACTIVTPRAAAEFINFSHMLLWDGMVQVEGSRVQLSENLLSLQLSLCSP